MEYSVCTVTPAHVYIHVCVYIYTYMHIHIHKHTLNELRDPTFVLKLAPLSSPGVGL